MLFGSARQIGTTGERSTARPNEFSSTNDVGRKELVLQVASIEANAFDQIDDLLCLGDVSRQRLLAGEAAQRAGPGPDRVDDLFDVRDARVIWSTQPQRIDRRIRNHVSNGFVRPRVTDVQLTCERSR